MEKQIIDGIPMDIYFAGSDFELHRDDVSEQLFEDLCDCGSAGDSTESVDYVLRQYNIEGDPDTCRAYLKGCGAWDDEELEDHEENLRRLIWLTGCALRDSDDAPAYFSAY